ncbi:hypothetical protein CICLE_v10017416mg [Citrus x clementina]|uniref:Uncharacterized protein n=1 Tax=Citrus clementina TaxID=85681 RepID=V4U9Z5_CITCL|nr:hypothetical protein CICLE_v10017416mg [Citrus x clementina]
MQRQSTDRGQYIGLKILCQHLRLYVNECFPNPCVLKPPETVEFHVVIPLFLALLNTLLAFSMSPHLE